jgi:hypothetical protein
MDKQELLELAEARVITALSEHGDNYLSFQHIAEGARLTRDEVVPIVRDLAKRGLAKFARGLWTDDGEMYGSGYALTQAGLAMADAAEETVYTDTLRVLANGASSNG